VLVDVVGLRAEISASDVFSGGIEEASLSLKAAARIVAEDPDDSDGKGRITRSDLAGLASVGDLFRFTPALVFEGQFLLGLQVGAFNTADWGNPILTITSTIENGRLVPDWFFDVSIGAESVRDNLTALFANVASVGAALDNSVFLAGRLPFLETGLGGLLQSSDGRFLGDVLSFQYINGESRGNVLADYYAKFPAGSTAPTYSGLIRQLQDYLAAEGDYTDLESLFPTQYGETTRGPFTVGGGLFLADQNEIQQLVLDDTVDGGTFRLTFTQGGQTHTTEALEHDASAHAVQLALIKALGGFSSVVSVEAANEVEIAFAGALAATTVTRIRVESSALFDEAGEPIDPDEALGLVTLSPSATDLLSVSVGADAHADSTFTLAVERDGVVVSTGSIAHDADALAVLSAILDALSTANPGATLDEVRSQLLGELSGISIRDVADATAGALPGALDVVFGGALAATNVAQLSVLADELSGGTGRVITKQQGGAKGLSLDLALNLVRAVSEPFNLGGGLNALGFELQGGGNLNLDLDIQADLSFGLALTDLGSLASGDSYFFQARNISAQVGASLVNFNAGVSLGVLEGSIVNGSLSFAADAGVVVKRTAESLLGGEKVSFNDFANAASIGDLIDAGGSVWAFADFPIRANLFGADLTKLTGGDNPQLIVEWGSAANPIDLALIGDANPVITKKNFTNLASLTSMTPAMMVQMLVNIGDFLNEFRDSSVFDIPFPFTGYNLGDAFDFAYGWTRVLNESLQGILSFELESEDVVSPRLSQDVAFDLLMERPGDLVPAAYTVTLFKADTDAFTHIDQLAEYISNRIASATAGALLLQERLPAWVREGQTTDTTLIDGEEEVNEAVTGTIALIDVLQQGGERVNATMLLDLSTATGELRVRYRTGAEAGVTIAATDSDAQVAAKISTLIAGRVGIAAENMVVIGNRATGFRIEFAGDVSGRAYTAADFVISMAVPSTATSSVVLTQEALTGQSEVKLLGFTGYGSGTFELQLYGQKTGPIRYVGDPGVQALLIEKALEGIVGVGNVSVSFPQDDPLDPSFDIGNLASRTPGVAANFGTAPKFLIQFKGALASRDIPDATIYTGALKPSTTLGAGQTRGVTLLEFAPGENARSAVQTVTVNSAPATPASFDLTWAHAGRSYTVSGLSSATGASELRAKLLQAIGDSIEGLDLRVSAPVAGSWQFSFGGSLAGVDVDLLQVAGLTDAVVPTVSLRTVQEAATRNEVQQVSLGASSGQYRVQLGGEGSLSATFRASATAQELQAILEALPEIGRGGVQVSGEAQRWRVEFTGALRGQDVPELVFNPVQTFSVSNAVAVGAESVAQTVSVNIAGRAGSAVGIAGFQDLTDHGAELALQAAIAQLLDVAATDVVVRAVDAGAGKRGFEITFQGALAGKTLQALSVGDAVTRTSGSIVTTVTDTVSASTVVASLIQVTARETELRSGGLTWGLLSFQPLNVDDFTSIAIIPTAGVAIDKLQAGNAATGLDDIQRIHLRNAAVGADSTFTLRVLTTDGAVFETAAIAVVADDAAQGGAIESAINAALGEVGAVSVDVDNETPGRVFEVRFIDALSGVNLPLIEARFAGLRAVPEVEAVAFSLQQGRPATKDTVARNTVQRIVFNNVSAVSGQEYGLAVSIDGRFYGIVEPLEWFAPASSEQLLAAGITHGELTDAERHAVAIQAALNRALIAGPRGIAGAEVRVTAVPGSSANSASFDIEYLGRLAGLSIPTILVFKDGLQPATSAQSFGNGSHALSFTGEGLAAQTKSGPKFTTLEDFAVVLESAINALLPAGETFSISARFDALAQDFLFDIRLTPSLPSLELPMNLGFTALEPLAGFEGKGVLGLDAGVDFIATIGIDFSRPNDFRVDSGLVYKAEASGSRAGGVAVGTVLDAPRLLLNDPGKGFDDRAQIPVGEGTSPNPQFNPLVNGQFEVDVDGDVYGVSVDWQALAPFYVVGGSDPAIPLTACECRHSIGAGGGWRPSRFGFGTAWLRQPGRSAGGHDPCARGGSAQPIGVHGLRPQDRAGDDHVQSGRRRQCALTTRCRQTHSEAGDRSDRFAGIARV
jgi:hypothetical protein